MKWPQVGHFGWPSGQIVGINANKVTRHQRPPLRKPELICSGNRQRRYSEARSVLAWLAVEEVGHPAAEVARFLGISRVGVLLSLEKAKDICQKYEFQLTPPTLQI